jgi:hypothetical protein
MPTTSLYADNVAINGGVLQPATFQVNEPFELEDSNGVVTFVTVSLSPVGPRCCSISAAIAESWFR